MPSHVRSSEYFVAAAIKRDLADVACDVHEFRDVRTIAERFWIQWVIILEKACINVVTRHYPEATVYLLRPVTVCFFADPQRRCPDLSQQLLDEAAAVWRDCDPQLDNGPAISGEPDFSKYSPAPASFRWAFRLSPAEGASQRLANVIEHTYASYQVTARLPDGVI